MAKIIGRIAAIGLALEDTQGSAEAAPDVYLPFNDGPNYDDKHEPLPIESSRSRREIDVDSKKGRIWSEGAIGIDLDVVNSGYLFKLALGNETLTTGSPNNHEFHTSVSGNTPKTATLWVDRNTDTRRFTGCAVDNLELAFEGDLATVTADFMGEDGTEAAGLTPVTTSGTVLCWANAAVKFGTTLVTADQASATPVNSFNLTVANNLEALFQSGQNTPTTIVNKGLKVTGSYVRFHEDVVDRDKFLAITKNSMIVTFTGNNDEEVRVRLAKIRLDTNEIGGDNDDLIISTGSFTAEVDTAQVPNQLDIRLQNDKADVYGA